MVSTAVKLNCVGLYRPYSRFGQWRVADVTNIQSQRYFEAAHAFGKQIHRLARFFINKYADGYDGAHDSPLPYAYAKQHIEA
jgi:hypothetical protein